MIPASAAASRNAVAAPTPPHGDIAWIASPMTVTRSDGPHGASAGTAEQTRSVELCATSWSSSRARMAGSHSAVSWRERAADSAAERWRRSRVWALKTSVREMRTQ